MILRVFSHGMKRTAEIKTHLERRLHFAVSRFAPRIERIEAGLIDVNGEDHGGVDKRCRLVAKVRGVGRLVVQDDDDEWLALIDRTADRLGRLVKRELERLRERGGRQSASGT